jgi:hypothetical protein
MITKRLSMALVGLTTLAGSTACNERPLAYGDANSIIAVMPLAQWELVDQEVYDALEPTIVTVREEKTFTVTHQEPYAQFWDRLRRFRQMLVVGSRDDAWVQEVLENARDEITENGLHQVYDVWSSGQTVTLVLLDPGWGPDDLRPWLPRVNELLDGQYRAFARNRMYLSGVDTALADTLALQAGFSVVLPDVYRWQTRDSIYIFRNDNPDPSELIRQISVSWVTPATGPQDVEQMLAWRERVVAAHYTEPQQVLLDKSAERTFTFEGAEALELQANWQNPPERNWPAGGPLIVRTVTCDAQDRTYLLDAWLYAPGKEKYEYMIQLETLLDTFRCGN